MQTNYNACTPSLPYPCLAAPVWVTVHEWTPGDTFITWKFGLIWYKKETWITDKIFTPALPFFVSLHLSGKSGWNENLKTFITWSFDSTTEVKTKTKPILPDTGHTFPVSSRLGSPVWITYDTYTLAFPYHSLNPPAATMRVNTCTNIGNLDFHTLFHMRITNIASIFHKDDKHSIIFIKE